MIAEGPETGALSDSERAELLRLRAEVPRLREQAPSVTARRPPPPRAERVRRWARILSATFLIALSCILAPLSVTAAWLRGEVTDTDRYVETVAPLAKDPAIQQAITTDLTDIVFTYIDVRGLTQRAVATLAERGTLPADVATQLEALAVPVANGVRSFAENRILQVVQSSTFAQAWVQANRTAHQQLVNALTGETGGGVTIEGNAVKVNLAAFIAVVKERLVANGFELAARIPEVNATFVVFQSADVGKAQRLFSLLNNLGIWLSVILLITIAIGIYLAPNHRLAFIGAGAGVALAMLTAAVGLTVLRRSYLDGMPRDVLTPDAAAVLFDTLVRFLREGLRAAFLLGILVALGGFFTGPSVTAVTVRRWFTTGFALLRGGLAGLHLPLTGATRWVAPRARALRVIAVTAALAFVLVQRYRTPELVAWTTAGLTGMLAIIEFLAVEPRKRAPSPSPSPS